MSERIRRATVGELNRMHEASAATLLLDCCGSHEWVRRIVERRPFADLAALKGAADEEWRALRRDDWLEAFRAHPRIGESAAAQPQSRMATGFSQHEQSGVSAAGAQARSTLAQLNADYEARFPHIFIVCATGLSAAEIEAQLRSRLTNPPEHELRVAAEEQRKIMQLRLDKLLED